LDYLNRQTDKHIKNNTLEIVTSSDFTFVRNRIEKILRTTPKGKFLTDGIASDLFLINSK
jgi:oxygen-independent coproporphyrinogen III oxidase